MNWLKRFFKTKAFALSVSKGQTELLEIFLTNKPDFDLWAAGQPGGKSRFQFYYPTAVDFYYGEFKLFTAFFKKGRKGDIELVELKMTETNFDTIRCANWRPFEDVILEFLNTMEESKKIALFEKRKMLYEYESLCAKNGSGEAASPADYPGAVSSLATR